jgi:hypothetical protein
LEKKNLNEKFIYNQLCAIAHKPQPYTTEIIVTTIPQGSLFRRELLLKLYNAYCSTSDRLAQQMLIPVAEFSISKRPLYPIFFFARKIYDEITFVI